MLKRLPILTCFKISINILDSKLPALYLLNVSRAEKGKQVSRTDGHINGRLRAFQNSVSQRDVIPPVCSVILDYSLRALSNSAM